MEVDACNIRLFSYHTKGRPFNFLGGVILKKNFLQGYSEQQKNTCTKKLGGGDILPKYLVGGEMLQSSMVAGIDSTSPRRSAGLIFRD